MGTEGISGSGAGRVNPEELYKQEYVHGADLFQKALQEFSKSENMYQKEQFKEVMDKAMVVLNDAARELKRQELLKQNQKIAKDYAAYKNNPSHQSQEILNNDLNKAKRSIS